MKKLLAVVAGLMTYSAVYALPVYNPDQPELLKYGVFTCGDDCWGVELGYRGDFVFDRQLKFKHHNDNLFDFHKDVCDWQNSINAGQLTINIWDRLDVYGWAGAAQTEFEVQPDYITTSALGLLGTTGFENVHGRTKEGFAWGVGARVVLWQSACGRTAIGVDGQYAYYRSKLQCLSFNGFPVQSLISGAFDSLTGLPNAPSRYSIKSSEWQVSLGISHRICWLVPYLAVKYSSVDARFSGPFSAFTSVLGVPDNFYSPKLRFKNRNTVGMVAGVTLVDSERMHVTAEGRFIDEKALTIAADFRF